MLIVNSMIGDADNILFNENNRDGCSEPYVNLKNEFKKRGLMCEGLRKQQITDINYIIYWDADSIYPTSLIKKIKFILRMKRYGGSIRDIKFEEKISKNKIGKILFLFEPNSISAENQNIALHDEMDIVFTWNKDLVDNKKYFHIFLPGPREIQTPPKNF